MEDKKILLDNIDKIHTTDMGIDRIKRNLGIDSADVVEYCKNGILDNSCNIYKRGKTGIAKLTISESLSTHIVIPLLRHILYAINKQLRRKIQCLKTPLLNQL